MRARRMGIVPWPCPCDTGCLGRGRAWELGLGRRGGGTAVEVGEAEAEDAGATRRRTAAEEEEDEEEAAATREAARRTWVCTRVGGFGGRMP